MMFKSTNRYRPIPFWSWNDKLDDAQLKKQISLMNKEGIGGFVMHARGGLETNYMGDEWFLEIDECVREGKSCNMYPFAYDENGWPSGYGNGIVTGRGEQYQQKYLRIEKGIHTSERTIANVDGFHLYYEVNPFYADMLMPENVECFIEHVYKKYLDRKDKVCGFFTDEPQLSRNGIPWSVILPKEFQKEYGESLIELLPQLFFDIGDFENTRMKFWRLVTRLFSENCFKRLYEYTKENNVDLIGHLVLEESLGEQLTPNGSVMPHYRYFSIPGIDLLGRELKGKKLTPIQVSSVAAQFGKKRVLSECYALTGWGISFEEIRRMFEWQSVRGITLICTHLQAYSLRGMRKRDFPPSVFYQQPWWEYYHFCTELFSKVGYLMAEGRQCADILLIHPQTTAWVNYKGSDKNEKIDYYNSCFYDIIDTLEKKHRLFHLGDEIIMEDSASVDGGEIIVGQCRYKNVIVPPHTRLLKNTERLLEEFRKSGGIVTTSEDIRPSEVIDNENISYTRREFDGFTLHYFVNSTDENQPVKINVEGSVYDFQTGLQTPLEKNTEILPCSSLMVFENIQCSEEHKHASLPLDVSGEWEIADIDDNVLLLDKCDCYFDGVLVGENMHILDVGEKAVTLSKKVRVKIVMRFFAEYIPENMCLVAETPEKFNIAVNGKTVKTESCGEFIDHSLKKMNISRFSKKGENIIEVECDFIQNDKVYEDIKNVHLCEVVKNKFAYSMEIESMYITGDFSLKTDGGFTELENNSLRYEGGFVIAEQKKRILPDELVREGYPFFSGKLKLEKTVNITDTNTKLVFEQFNATVAEICVNGKAAGVVYARPYEKDLSGLLKIGENKISVCIINSLRNLFGPHHMEQGECHCVTPSSFYKKTDVWGTWGSDKWNDGYAFIKTGFKTKKGEL